MCHRSLGGNVPPTLLVVTIDPIGIDVISFDERLFLRSVIFVIIDTELNTTMIVGEQISIPILDAIIGFFARIPQRSLTSRYSQILFGQSIWAYQVFNSNTESTDWYRMMFDLNSALNETFGYRRLLVVIIVKKLMLV